MLGTKYETPKRLQKDIKARKSKDSREKNNIVDPFFIEIFGIFFVERHLCTFWRSILMLQIGSL